MPIIELKGELVNFWIGNGGFLKGREIILFIHGAGGSQFVWSFQKRYFEKEFNPIIIELPGHGSSEGDGRDEISRYCEDVFCFIKEMKLQKIFLVGHSMGGAIVQMMALKYPELMKGIILVGTGARLRVNASILNGIRNHFEEIIPKLVSFAYYQGAPKELIERGAEILRKCKPEVLFRDFLACDRFDIMNEVRNINLPTLIICGLEDKLTPVKYATYLHQMIKGSRLQIISKAGHMVMMEAPRIFNEKLKEFILSQKMIS